MMKREDLDLVLVTGIAGGLAQIVTKLLFERYPSVKVIGVDSRKIKFDVDKKTSKKRNFKTMQMEYTRGNFERLFRENKFDLVLNLARFSLVESDQVSVRKRQNFSVMGTSLILDLCLKYKVKKIVMLSTYHVYGALPDNAVFLTEDSPLRASMKFSDLRDVVEMDQIATTWMWKHQQKISMVIFRPCNIIGPDINNAMTRFLRFAFSPMPLDYNPMFQFINEMDMANVLVDSIEKVPLGVYNVAPDDFIPIRKIKRLLGGEGSKMSFYLLGHFARILNKAGSVVPEYLINFLKYSCMIDNSEIKKYLGENFCEYSIADTIQEIKEG